MNGGHLGGKHRFELIVRLYALDHGKHETEPVKIKTVTDMDQLLGKAPDKITVRRSQRLNEALDVETNVCIILRGRCREALIRIIGRGRCSAVALRQL